MSRIIAMIRTEPDAANMSPPRPHPLYRSSFAELANKVLAASWGRRLNEKPRLEPDYLWQVGARGYDHADEASVRLPEDVADFRERLDVLCRSLREEAQLNSLGHTMAYGQITSAIRKRHALGRLWRTNPALAQIEIACPIAVIGQMRAGTTRVHRLLAADPRFAGTRFCDSHDPVPKAPDWRPVKAAMGLALARRVNPWLDMLHPFGAARIDEEIGWLSGAFSPCAFESQWRIPSFVAFSEARDQAPVYREFARILRTDAATRKNADKPRVLKCPQFSEDVPSLLNALPGTRFVFTHRDRHAVWQSSVSLVASQMAFQSDNIELTSIESEWQRKLDLRERRIGQTLETMDAAMAHVEFEALGRDWQTQIASVYASLGLDPSGDAIEAMAAEHARAKDDRHHAHGGQLAVFAESRS